MKTKQNITVRIADAGQFNMKIDPESEEVIRRAEYNLNKVWGAWRNDFNTKSSKEVLAMVTFQFAKRYYQLLEQVERQQVVVDDFEAELDRLLDIVNSDTKAEQADS